MFSTALRPGNNILNTSLDIIPKGATLDAFHRVLFDSELPNWLFNSLVVTLGTAAVGLILAATSAYAFSRYKFRSAPQAHVPVRDPAHPGHHAAGADLSCWPSS